MAIKIRDGGAWVDVGGGSGSGSGPIGSIIYYPSSSPPDGYLKANGASLNTSTYSDLFSVFGYTFGGSGSSFNLPDLRGEFIRGWDDGRGVDSGRGVGSFQQDIFKRHRHYHNQERLAAFPPNESPRYYWNTSANYVNPGFTQTGYTGYEGSISDTETRPRNVALLVCIKYQ